MKDAKLNSNDSLMKKAGDKIQKVGEKISDAGAKKAGGTIYNVGNKNDHWSEDPKSPQRNKK